MPHTNRARPKLIALVVSVLPRTVTIYSGMTTTLEIEIDTGIR